LRGSRVLSRNSRQLLARHSAAASATPPAGSRRLAVPRREPTADPPSTGRSGPTARASAAGSDRQRSRPIASDPRLQR
jgi:hypothetical protein